ncbi:MAG TPA: hypothetical protein VNS46_02510 [Nocardioides sp.]|nr:hypothetical protein [Nocardioides sp.]
MLRRLVVPAALAAMALSGCSHESDHATHVRPESPDEFARRALGAMDAAAGCPALAKAWDEYLAPDTRAAVTRLVPCTRRVLAARHDVVSVSEHGGEWLELPDALDGADVHAVQLVDPDRPEAVSFPLSDLLDDGWFVVTQGDDRWLHNPGIVALDECLAVQKECQLAG